MVNQKIYRNATLIALIVVVLLVVGVLVVNKGFGVDRSSSARSSVTQFGLEMQKVSLLSPDASSTIATIYGPLATKEMIRAWQEDIEHAPGRLTSSPWPAGIDIINISKQGSGYIVSGNVVFATSDGVVGTTPVVIQVVPVDGKWLIGAYQEQVATTTKAK